MLAARALYYALMIAFIIALSSSLLISLAYLQRVHQNTAFDGERLVRNLNSGIALLKAGKIGGVEETAFDLYGEGRDSIWLAKRKWGLFDVAYAKVHSYQGWRRDTLVKAFFLGNRKDSTLRSALYLSDRNKPLGLAGKTSLKGWCQLPKADIKSAYIDGVSYFGAQLVYGKKTRSRAQLPPVREDRIASLMQQFKTRKGRSLLPAQVQQSFLDTTVYVQGDHIYLDGISLKGNIIVIAQTAIHVSASANLDGIQLYAPVIQFEAGFKGNLQAFALSELQVGAACQFEYPSVLGLLKTAFSRERPIITVAENSVVAGLVFIKTIQYTRFPPKLLLEKNTLVEGQVFVNGSFEHRGTVYGNVSCDQFHLRTSAAVYDNHLLNATIDRTRLSKYFIAPLYAATSLQYETVKWVD